MEVIEGLFADGRLNAPRRPAPDANDLEVYLTGGLTVQMHSCEPSSDGDRDY